jgi:integrase
LFASQVIAMRGKQAKILSDDNLDDLLLVAETSRHPLRNKAIVLLSAKAGLRAGEIARLTWAMVTDPTGRRTGLSHHYVNYLMAERASRAEHFHSAFIGHNTGMSTSGNVPSSPLTKDATFRCTGHLKKN